MKPSYPWRCFACDATNPVAVTACENCGFPSQASAQQIEEARASRSGQPVNHFVKPQSVGEGVRELLAPLPLWRKLIAMTGMALFTAGLIWFKITFMFPELLLSFAVAVVGFMIIFLACANNERSRTL